MQKEGNMLEEIFAQKFFVDETGTVGQAAMSSQGSATKSASSKLP